MPPFLVVAIGAIGAAALMKLLARESRRVNAELDETRRDAGKVNGGKVNGGTSHPTLKRDPATGEYRPGNP
ncbi:MAG: hypothetical protein K0R27_437 [Xanthobacteraceae bacterium]|jgi:hypothetical protein|nr:hypothetical protein [Xanthobacteraceae bacterium]